MKNKIVFSLLILFITSCQTIPSSIKNTDCSRIDDELNLRYYLFDKLSKKEIKAREKLDAPTYSSLDKLSVFSKIVEGVRNASPDSRIIPVDLRYYRTVALGNIIITNYQSDARLDLALKTTKYSQGFFVLINFGKDDITIVPVPSDNVWERQKIARNDLKDIEILFNVSDAGWIIGNMKFTPNKKISILADRVKQPFSLDLRENSNLQFHFGEKWFMPVYSIAGSDIVGGKDTSGFIWFVNNENTKRINITKFYKSEVACYKDENGPKFNN